MEAGGRETALDIPSPVTPSEYVGRVSGHPDPAARDELRRKLAEAPVVATRQLPGGTRSAAGIVVVTLEGGIEAFWKRGDVEPPGVMGIHREVAAYELALLLGWEDLLQVVAHRYEAVAGGGVAEVASIELLPHGADDLAASQFPAEDVERAGMFDALIQNNDRGGHNWRGLPEPGGGHRLKLYDHELAFDPSRPVNSTFWNEIGQQVPAGLVGHLQDAAPAVAASRELEELLGINEVAALRERFARLAP